MKWELQPGDGGVRFQLATDRPLPLIFDFRMLKGSSYTLCDLLHRTPPSWQMQYARRVARRNNGRVPFELVHPARVYRNLLQQLGSIDGIVEIRDVNRYTLWIEHGRLFDPAPLGLAVGSVISRELYPHEAVEFKLRQSSEGADTSAFLEQP